MNDKSMGKAIIRVVTAAVLATAGSAALAAWDFNASSTSWSSTSTGTAAAGNTAVATDSNGVTATARAFYAGTSFTSGTTFAKATLGKNDGGLGVISRTETTASPDHAIDNNGNTDMVLFNFSTAIDLNKVILGWSQTDADFSVLRYTGETPLNAGGGLNYSTVGWKLVKDVNGSASSSSKTYDIADANPNTTTSSWWLISAFNTGFGGSNSNVSSNKDYFKLASLDGTYTLPTTTAVPEPTSLALMGAALVGLVGARRRRNAKR